ncbi:MAG TPA: TolC family protein [Gammaproteobacteria bacterium]|nr:TolC family protein [Gammaproteobacteria bacterium]
MLIFATTAVANQDELFIHSDQLDIKQLIQAVLTRNPTIEAMQSAWKAAESRIDQVTALDDPVLSYSFAPETLNQSNQDFGQKIQLSQKIPWPGKLALRGDSARFESRAHKESIELVRQKLIETTARTFSDWYYIHEAQRINRVNQGLWREFHAIAELKYSTGRVSKQDVLRAEVEQAMLEHQSIVLQRKQHNILARLNTLLNRIPDSVIPSPAALPMVRLLPSVEQLRVMALETHPGLKVLTARLRASEVRVKSARRDFYPDFKIIAGYNSLWNQNEKRFTVGVGINIPLSQINRKAKVSEYRAKTLQLKWRIKDKQAVIAGNVQRGYNNVNEIRHILKLYRNKLLPLAEDNLHAAKADYQSGKGSFLDLVSAEKNLVQTRLNNVQALTDYHRHLAMLARHVGNPDLLYGNFNIPSHSDDVIKGELQ